MATYSSPNRSVMCAASERNASAPVSSKASRLKSKSRPSSCSLARATEDRLLATRLTVMKAKKATQSCGSLMLKVPTGGRKKKSNASAATTDASAATQSRDEAATKRMINRKDSATVVGLVKLSHETYRAVRPAMAPMEASSRTT